MAQKRVTQATFDETVRENMEEFEMDRPEAVADAVKQFTSQGTHVVWMVRGDYACMLIQRTIYAHAGVDLSNVCITATAADEEWLAAHVQTPLDALTAALDNGARDTLPEPLDAPVVLAALEALTAAASSVQQEEGGHEHAHAHVHEHGKDAADGCCGSGVGAGTERAANARKMVAARQGMNLVARLWGIEEDGAGEDKGREVLLAALALVQALLTREQAETGELRDSLWPTGMGTLCGAAKGRPQDVGFLLVRACGCADVRVCNPPAGTHHLTPHS